MMTLLAIALGFVLDLLLGDPRWLPHPVVAMGRAISWLEPRLRASFPDTPEGRRSAGKVLAFVLPVASLLLSWGVLALLGLVSPWLRLAGETWLCYQVFATRELWRQTMVVRSDLHRHDLDAARHDVSMVVGRETARLSESEVARAAVETVAESASDGVVAPLVFMLIGGAPLALAYKAVNTMDSMVGYKNECYIDFGRAAALADDVVNWVPARFAGICIVVASALVSLDVHGAWRVWRRDHMKSESPNAAQTEAAMAGALGLQLGGDSTYFGRIVHKPTLGDFARPVEADDIARANRLMVAACLVALVSLSIVRVAVLALAGAL